MSISYEVEINGVPDGSMVVGCVATLKVLLPDGRCFWSTRTSGMNDMECLGVAQDMVYSFAGDLQQGKEVVRGE